MSPTIYATRISRPSGIDPSGPWPTGSAGPHTAQVTVWGSPTLGKAREESPGGKPGKPGEEIRWHQSQEATWVRCGPPPRSFSGLDLYGDWVVDVVPCHGAMPIEPDVGAELPKAQQNSSSGPACMSHSLQ